MNDRDLYRSIAKRVTAPNTWSIAEAARETGVSINMLRTWSRRYGWPCPRRSGSGARRFTAADLDLIRRVVAAVAGGALLRDLLAYGAPDFSRAGRSRIPATPPPPPPRLDLGSLAAPRTSDGDAVRTSLQLALIQRHPGLVRHAIAQRLRLHPADREACVDGVLRLAAEQLNDPPWLLEAMHA